MSNACGRRNVESSGVCMKLFLHILPYLKCRIMRISHTLLVIPIIKWVRCGDSDGEGLVKGAEKQNPPGSTQPTELEDTMETLKSDLPERSDSEQTAKDEKEEVEED